MTAEPQTSDTGSGDTATPPTMGATTNKSPKVNESTLLTPAQTYFADEKIQIPETAEVS